MRVLASSPGKRQLCGDSAQPSFSAGHTATGSEPRTRRPPDRAPLTRHAWWVTGAYLAGTLGGGYLSSKVLLVRPLAPRPYGILLPREVLSHLSRSVMCSDSQFCYFQQVTCLVKNRILERIELKCVS
ncbi:hypothetical protein J1605_001721 [Eschrichtius robustus]|uniref:Uncharacterized protein n=1 Tax=Eschrichtius robustus TaxID=9764 RepID=A0AB34I151_ESCRO|nr:hypothetical protein J1605_001721 [Eschrichtius robustus]